MHIDLHGHFAPRDLLRSPTAPESWRWSADDTSDPRGLRRGPRERVPFIYEAMDVDGIVAALDRLRIDVMALSLVPPLIDYRLADAPAVAAARQANEAISAAVEAHPTRFVGLGTIPLQNPRLAVNELRRLMGDARLRGVQLGSNVAGIYLGDQRFWPVWEAIEALGAVVLVHPMNLIGRDRLDEYFLDNLIGNPVETARCTADLVFSGVLERFPGLKIVLPHGGGAGPALWGRWDHGFHQRAEARGRIDRRPSEYVKTLYFDSITHSSAALESLVRFVGADHVVIGTDYPFDMGPAAPVDEIDATSLTEEQKRMVKGGTAQRLLGLSAVETEMLYYRR